MNSNTGEILSRPESSASPPSSPANTPPIADAKNHKPNIWPMYFLGAYCENAERPIGDNASSPQVCSK